MKKILCVLAAVVALFAFNTGVWAGAGTVLKKGSDTVVVYQSASDSSKHWVERNNYRSKKSGSARSAIQRYESRGYRKAGTKQW